MPSGNPHDVPGSTVTHRRRKRHFLAYKRRWVIWGAVLLLLAVLVAYNVLTDAQRVRRFVEAQLSDLIGGPVHVEYATFSIMRGLSLENVTIATDDSGDPESVLATAGHLSAEIDYGQLLRLKPRLRRVEARNLRVNLIEDPQSATWNFDRLVHRGTGEGTKPTATPTPGGINPVEAPSWAPEIQIHDAEVRCQRQTPSGPATTGLITIEASAVPLPEKRYGISISTSASQNAAEKAPRTGIIGILDRHNDEVTGRVSDLYISPTICQLLPGDIGRWLRELSFSGRFSIPSFRYRFGSHRKSESFQVLLRFDDTQATITPEHWLSSQERWQMGVLRQSIGAFDAMGMARPLGPSELAAEEDDSASPRDLIAWIDLQTRGVPLRMERIRGSVLFTEKDIALKQLDCEVQGQALQLSGTVGGYNEDSAAHLSLKTPRGTFVQIPPSRRFMSWLPEDARRTYQQFKPEGKGTIDIQISRDRPGGPLLPKVVVDVFDTVMQFEDFPYPLQHCEGRFVFSHDPESGTDLLRIENLHGHGVPGGTNVNSSVYINGTIGPFVAGGPGIDVRIQGIDIHSEPAIREAFPREVAKAMLLFGPLDYGARMSASADHHVTLSPEETVDWPHFEGDFNARVTREPGPKKGVDTSVDMLLKSATGTFRPFPYPMENLTCTLKIRDDFLAIDDLRMKRNGAELGLHGTVKFTDPVDPEIFVDARNVAIDADLLDALPAAERSWIQRAGLGGRIDIAGRVFVKMKPGTRDADTDFALALQLHDAWLLKDKAGPAISTLNGNLELHPARLELKDVTGRRGEASVHVMGVVDWADGTPDVDLNLTAQNLLLDRSLHDLLPSEAQAAWDQQKPEGTTDLDLRIVVSTPPVDAPATAPSRPSSDRMRLVLRPRQLSATPEVFPYHIEDLKGEIVIDGKEVTLNNVTGRHGAATLRVDGGGTTSPLDFHIKATADQLTADRDLLAAIPESVSEAVASFKPEGVFAVRIDKLDVRQAQSKPLANRAAGGSKATPGPTTRVASTQPVDVDFDTTVTTSDGKVNVGVPIAHVDGSVQFAGEVRADSLVKMDAPIRANSFEIFGRKGGEVTALLRRPAYSQDILVQSLKSRFAGGSLAGDVTIQTRPKGPSQYAVSMVMQKADLTQIAGDALKKPVSATISGSFDGEGIMDASAERRGRGHIQILGKDMYEAPIVLGFFRMVNLALPVRDGVNEVDVSYTYQRDRATLDSIEMVSPGLRIYGDGVLDFSAKTVDLTLNTENPDALPWPILQRVVRRAREELMQIRIRGSIQEPQVKTMMLPTFQTTLDHVVEDVKRGQK